MVGGALMMGGGTSAVIAAQQAKAGGPKPKGGKKTPGGFYVKVSGRLLHGVRDAEPVAYVENEYFPNLRAKAEALGDFHVPDDTDKQKSFTRSAPVPYILPTAARPSLYPGATGVGGPSAAADATLDPVTQESMSTDWKIDFGFKLRLGPKPKPEDKPAAKEDPKKGGKKRP